MSVRFYGMELITLRLPDRMQKNFKVALVDEPAIESEWMAFSKKENFKVVSKDKRIVMGYAMIADKEIPRWSPTRGAYKVVFPKEAIDVIVQNFKINALTNNTNEMHEESSTADGVYVLWDFQLYSDLGIKAPEGFKQEADGSWFMAMRVENDEIWKKVLAGEYTGFSIEGSFLEEEAALVKLETELKKLLHK